MKSERSITNEEIPVAGVDVSKGFSDMCILAPNNAVFARAKIYHDKTSLKRDIEQLQKAETESGVKPEIVMEATGHYHRIFHQFLSMHGYNVIVINPI